MKKYVFTGGGTAGHITPNIALIDKLKSKNTEIHYIASNSGLEEAMLKSMAINYHGVSSGKLRRYFSWQNFIDPFRIMLGIIQATILLHKIKPNVLFSKGGFVAFPVVVGAWLNKIPVIAHESDITPGLANKLSYPFVNRICLNFAKSRNYFKHKEKLVVTGTPIRESLFKGDKEKALNLCAFNAKHPILLIIGGSQGAAVLNNVIRKSLPILCNKLQVIHLCGKGKIDQSLVGHKAYYQIEYAKGDMAHLLSAADYVLSRAGANSLCELLALKKPHILVPLSLKSSRGDQLDNARFFEKKGASMVLQEEDLSTETLLDKLNLLEKEKERFIAKMDELALSEATDKILEILQEY